MNRRRKNQERTPLFVQQVIIPDKRKPEITENCLKKNAETASNHLRNKMDIHVGKTVDSFVKIGDHEVRSVGELLILEKKPLENYFEGTVEKKQVKRKSKHQRATQSSIESDHKELQTEPNGKEIPMVSKQFFKEKESVVKDKKAEMKRLQLKIDEFEKIRELKNQKNHIKQRLAEEKYIQQQENLAVAWWEFMKRRNQRKQLNSGDALIHPEPFYRKKAKTYNGFCISVTSRKFWSDDQADKSRKKPEDDELKKFEPSLGQSMLEKTFLEKLVFIDD